MNQVGDMVVTKRDCSASTAKIQFNDNSWMSILTWSLQKKAGWMDVNMSGSSVSRTRAKKHLNDS